MIIDAHAHLWKKQAGIVNGKQVYDIGGGRSNFGGEIKQMMPPYITDGENNIDRFIANMDYAGVSGAVITQEYIDGNQDEYLKECKKRYENRLKICSLYEEKKMGDVSFFDGIKICAGRLSDRNLLNHLEPFKIANESGKFISIDLADGNEQTEMMQKIIEMFPDSPYIHIGGDEANIKVWDDCVHCREYMQKNNIKNVKEYVSQTATNMGNNVGFSGNNFMGNNVNPTFQQQPVNNVGIQQPVFNSATLQQPQQTQEMNDEMPF